MPNPDPTAPDPGPRPEPEENLTYEQTIAKWGADLDPAAIRETVIAELVHARMWQIAGDRKRAADQKAEDAWLTAYIKRYGTDEG